MAYTVYTGNIANPGVVTGSTYTIGGAGGAGSSSASVTIPTGGYTLATGSGTMWNSTSYNYTPAVNITSNGIEMEASADIKIGNVSLKDTLETIQQRLAILVPNPKKLEKYEALKQAYDHYKTLEALCSDEEEK